LKDEQSRRVNEAISVDGIPDDWAELYGVWQKIGHENTYKIRKKYMLRFRAETMDWLKGTKVQANWITGQYKHYKLNPNLEENIKEIFEVTEEPKEVVK
jgi:hypothetical protein